MELVVEVAAPAVEELARGPAPADAVDSQVREAELRAEVAGALEACRARQGAKRNADLSADELDRFAPLEEEARSLLGLAARRRGLSARAIQSLRRVARTVADLEGRRDVASSHLAQALALRAELA
jgi:magnesium chelatase family protein